jgi:hypothetical protein
MVYNTRNYWVMDFVHRLEFQISRKQHFGNWICFRPQVKGRKTHALLDPLERTN